MLNFKNRGVDRIIDANLNRLKEGLRVCEEVVRFIVNSRTLTEEFKRLRHGIDGAIKRKGFFSAAIRGRRSLNDPGREIYVNELKRKGIRDIFCANMQRVKESMRVLEEFSKLRDADAAIRFKRLRYRVYEVEKKAIKRISALSHHR